MTDAIKINEIDDFRAYIGKQAGVSPWRTIDQAQIDKFAEATGDLFWIHYEPEKARHGPFGSTIAHGFLSLSLIPQMFAEIFDYDVPFALNYGLNRVRFPAPVPVNSSIRLNATIVDIRDFDGGFDLIFDSIVEINGSEKPACVAQSIMRVFRQAAL